MLCQSEGPAAAVASDRRATTLSGESSRGALVWCSLLQVDMFN